jgi:hypothetical protein
MKRHLIAVAALLAAASAAAQQSLPALQYAPPPNFYRSAIAPPEDYSAKEFNAGLQVYPFRPFSGSIEQMFRRTLLREWIEPRFQEANVAAPPEFRPVSIAGAQAAFTARFVESVAGGMPRQRLRMVIVAGNAAAIVDASASSMETWQRALPALNAMSGTLRVAAGTPQPDIGKSPAPGSRAVAGLYMGTKPKYVVDLNRSVGSGAHVQAPHYYLFSAGRVYRAYDELKVPGGDAGRFDFDAAQRADPDNSGRYTVEGERLHILIGGKSPETIAATALQRGRVTIDSVVYVRQ